MKQIIRLAAILLVALVAVSPSPANRVAATSPEPPGSSAPSTSAVATNLLVNGDFDQVGFYWRYPNHFVGGGWFEYWIGSNQPEFLDGGIIYHNVCYPTPPDGICGHSNNHSQGYIRWGAPYKAGIYQLVPATPCVSYTFSAWVRNDESNYHPKVGIDVKGTQLPFPGQDYTSHNCPGGPCPNPSIPTLADMPQTIVWGQEFNAPSFTWTNGSVTAEAQASTIGVWTFVAPEDCPGCSPSRSTYWDVASLVQVQSSSGRLITGTLPPNDNSFITGVTSSTTAIRANLSWQTSQPAVTQVLYHWVGSMEMTTTTPITSVADFESSTAVDSAASTSHSARLANLRPTSIYDYAILARSVVGSACQTSVVTGRFNTTDALVPAGALPAPSSDIVGPVIKPHDAQSVYVIWQSAESSYAQVLYHHVVTPTVDPTLTNHVYLPIVQSATGTDSTANYELRTSPEFTATTLHVIEVTGLLTDSQYTAVAVSAWSEGDQDEVAVSARVSFSTESTSLLRAASVGPNQLAEQLQACLADGEKLGACVNELPR